MLPSSGSSWCILGLCFCVRASRKDLACRFLSGGGSCLESTASGSHLEDHGTE